MTISEQDAKDIQYVCGENYPNCFDVTLEKPNGEIVLILDWTGAKNWDELIDMCKRGASKKYGFRIKNILSYQERTMKYTVVFYNEAGGIIEKQGFNSLRKARKYGNDNNNRFSAHSWLIYDIKGNPLEWH